jgi:tetratricopeptide (TPR) repeat protein
MKRLVSLKYFWAMALLLTVFSAHAQANRTQGDAGLTEGLSEPKSTNVSEEYTAFLKLLRSKDTAAQRKFLAQWAGIGQQDPEFYVCYANYYLNLANKEVIQMSTTPPQNGKESYSIQDSVGNTVGYMYSVPSMDEELSAKSRYWLNQGIARFPRRLDLLFGKVHLFGLMRQHDSFGTTILQAIEKSVENDFQWQWSKGIELQDGKQFLFSTCQDYIAKLFYSDDSLALIWIEPISLALLDIDPKNVPCISNLAVSNMMLKRWSEAIPYLEKAYALDSHDDIVLANLGYSHFQLQNKSQAQKYYKLLKKSKDAQNRELAGEMLKLAKKLK